MQPLFKFFTISKKWANIFYFTMLTFIRKFVQFKVQILNFPIFVTYLTDVLDKVFQYLKEEIKKVKTSGYAIKYNKLIFHQLRSCTREVYIPRIPSKMS